ncbi:MAG TPA: alpha,alpha-trehalase TreF [Cyclobacteriaceae bacterium]|nr:alpha,alpha-trehalase TreF [Cyclobacteriaceae bacterium]
MNRVRTLLAILCISACTSPAPKDFYSSSLFHEVQIKAVFPDSKTFADCTPRKPIAEIIRLFDEQKNAPDFDISQFVHANFELPVSPTSNFKTDLTSSMEEHITRLWPVLTRKPDDYREGSSLIPLPNPYIVPGGRFSEVYYWDSYFTMLGLQAQGRYDMIRNMVNNFAFLIDSIGFIPNGNRNYYLGRSQPPYFSLMVKELASGDSMAVATYLGAMVKEYEFWMSGVKDLNMPGDVSDHVVMVEEGVVLNRYWDRIPRPRPEAYKEDYNLAQKLGRNQEEIYRDLRAAAESGIDFSSRWFDEGKGIETIHTTQFVPVDLNSLLYHLEKMISQGYRLKGDEDLASSFEQKAEMRKEAIIKYCWDSAAGYFFDYNYVTREKSKVKTLAATYPLFVEIVDQETAERVGRVLENEFLKPGGLVTTLNDTGEQWDAPNGWAPLQWMGYKGLKNYKLNPVAGEIKNRWLKLNARVFKSTGSMMEKYNVMDTTLLAGGGEYPNQDGFGWTNGVALALMSE